ncbi:response regulator [Candidatus Sumerlaeota bacterium]|nr:response regulator [Candidatus Sumerlaeota bacterium]
MTKKRILVADDEEDVKEIIARILETQGYAVVTAYDGLDAVEKIRSEKPDLVLLDIMMPVLDGYEVCKRIQQDEQTANIPVVFLSAAADQEAVTRGMNAGAKDYVVKPFEPKKLLEKVNKVIGPP